MVAVAFVAVLVEAVGVADGFEQALSAGVVAAECRQARCCCCLGPAGCVKYHLCDDEARKMPACSPVGECGREVAGEAWLGEHVFEAGEEGWAGDGGSVGHGIFFVVVTEN